MILFTSLPVSAESTAEMVSACKALAGADVTGDKVTIPQDFASGLCWGAFSSLQHVVRTYTGEQPIFRVCAPPKSTRSQFIAVFVEYARRNPQRLHEDFLDVVLDSLRRAFPCPSR